jgi:DNA mismatch endonuclease (patch repair protein)
MPISLDMDTLGDGDRPSPERSALMARVRGKDTTPELRVRRIAHALGLRFRLHCRSLPGQPDIVFPRHRKIILVHGCFWHRHEGCSKASVPKTRVEFWQEKFSTNVARDARTHAALLDGGWDVCTIWECETKDPERLRMIVAGFLMPA